jgi:glycosyltransferase involved in cell wall biosynthesis
LKKLLIITYYWPPAGGSGVQRWLKFVKYFRRYGYEPVVYTPENPEFMAYDQGLLSEIPQGIEVIKRKIFEPYNLYKIFTGRRGEAIKPGFIADSGGSSNKSFKETFSLFVRSNLFVPDPKCMWIRPSIKYLTRYLKTNPVDAIVSTGPPHSMHLIARGLARKTGIKWIADFRDPWTTMYTFKYMKNTLLTKLLHKRMERSVIREADAVVVVTNFMKEEFLALKPKRIEVITNGFDASDFAQINESLEDKFTITYTGLFVKDRNPSILWRILGDMVKEVQGFGQDLLLRIIGHTDGSVWSDILDNSLDSNLVSMDYMPHEEVIKWQRRARILLLAGGQEPEAKGILTGKFFEYLAARRPILGFGPIGGDMDIALKESEAGVLFDYNDYTGARIWIENQYTLYKKGEIYIPSGKIDNYSRERLCGRMASLLDDVIEE